jgi:hypothetical protein
MLSEDLVEFLLGPVILHVATGDATRQPHGARAWGVAIDADRTHLTAFVHKSVARELLAALGENPRIAMGVDRPHDHLACQVKGDFVGSRAATAGERNVVQQQCAAFEQELQMIGVSPMIASRWQNWPCVALRMRVTDIFTQTPGPGAGEPMP